MEPPAYPETPVPTDRSAGVAPAAPPAWPPVPQGAEPEAVETFRLALCVAAQRTIAAALGPLGVSAPDSM